MLINMRKDFVHAPFVVGAADVAGAAETLVLGWRQIIHLQRDLNDDEKIASWRKFSYAICLKLRRSLTKN
jgi:hypothetical protein